MSDRIKGLTVTLRPDMRDDDAEHVIDAIRMIKGVIGVESHIANMDHHLAVRACKYEIRDKIVAIIDALK